MTTPGDGAGLDCLGLLLAVAGALDLRGRNGEALCCYDRTDYSKYPDGITLQSALSQALWPREAGAAPEPGGIALFRLEGNPQHLAIISDYPGGGCGLIHAYAPLGRVVEHRLDHSWQRRLAGVYYTSPPRQGQDHEHA